MRSKTRAPNALKSLWRKSPKINRIQPQMAGLSYPVHSCAHVVFQAFSGQGDFEERPRGDFEDQRGKNLTEREAMLRCFCCFALVGYEGMLMAADGTRLTKIDSLENRLPTRPAGFVDRPAARRLP